jgi:hypothetical protein
MDTDKFMTLRDAAREPYITEEILKILTVRTGRIPFFWDGIAVHVREKDVEDFFNDLIEKLSGGEFEYSGNDPSYFHPTILQMELMDEYELDTLLHSL